MGKQISVKEVIKSAVKNKFVQGCGIPMGYGVGLPILQEKNGCLCMLMPYLKYEITGVVDKTRIYPIRYGVVLELPEEKGVEFTNYEYDERFESVQFDKAIGLFRHEAIKSLNKTEYNAKKDALYALYDKLANSLVSEETFSDEDEKQMKELMKLLMEPCLVPFYKVLDEDFYNRFLA